MAALNANVFATHTPVTLGLLRNGPATDVNRTARESSIDPKFFFNGVRWGNFLAGDPDNLSTPCPVAVLLQAQVTNAFTSIVEEAVAKATAAYNAAAPAGVGGAPFDNAAARATAAADASNRVEAIALGSAHTSLVQSYRIADTDLNATERGRGLFGLTEPAQCVDQAAYNTAMRTTEAGWTVTLVSGSLLADATAAEVVGLNMVAMTTVEVEVSFAVMSMSQAAPVRSGAQLFEDGHHYHSDVDGSARHRAIEREVTARLSAEARANWKANIMRYRNIIWHAGPHVVLVAILEAFAEDPDMPSRLDATGYGSMSVGLPAMEDLFRRAGSYAAVYNQTRVTAQTHGHALNIDNMTETVAALGALPRRGGLPVNRPALPGKPAAPWPAGCNTRAKALKLFLEPALDRAEPVAAWMFGFYREVCARTGVRATAQEGSLLRSYSLKRAVANYLGEANRAQEMYSAYSRFLRSRAEDGEFETYTGTA